MNESVIGILRTQLGDENFVLLHVDTICMQENLPKFDGVFLTIDGEPQIVNGFHKYSGNHLILPIALVPFMSFSELQMIIHWCYLDSHSKLVARYKEENALAVLTKSNTILSLWGLFLRSSEFKELKATAPQKILTEFSKILHSKIMLDTTKISMESNVDTWKTVKRFSNDQLSRYIDNSTLVFGNKVFELDHPEFIDIASELFKRANLKKVC